MKTVIFNFALIEEKAQLIELIHSMNASEFERVFAVISSNTSSQFQAYLKALSSEQIECLQELADDSLKSESVPDYALCTYLHALSSEQKDAITTRLSIALIEFFEDDILEKLDDLAIDEIINESEKTQELSIDYCQ